MVVKRSKARPPRRRSARPASPEEIADAVAYLAQARSVTGQTIFVDGGQRLAWRTPDVIAGYEGD